MVLLGKIMILQGVGHPISCLGVCYANDPKKGGYMTPASALDLTTSLPGDFVHFLRLSQSAQSVPSSRFLAQTLRGGIQALLSRCTSLPIIACSSVALSKCLQMMGQHRPTRVHTGRDAGSVFVWVMSKNPWHSSPCPQRRRLVHQLHSDRFPCHQVGCIIHHPHVT